jgi:hypothetical protein
MIKPFYVAAIVKPLCSFCPSLASFLEELYHIVPISLHTYVLVLRRTGRAMRVSTSQDRGDPYHYPWLNPEAPGSRTSIRLAASCGVGTRVSNDLLSVRALAPVTRYSLRLSTTGGRPRGGNPISTTACCAGPAFSRVASTSTQTEVCDPASPEGFSLFEHCPRGYHPSLEEAPERNK